jgi:hypothetical protein
MTTHSSTAAIEVGARTESVVGLTLDDLRRFLADADTHGIPGQSPVTVGGLSEYGDVQGQRSYWAKRIAVWHRSVARP